MARGQNVSQTEVLLSTENVGRHYTPDGLCSYFFHFFVHKLVIFTIRE